MGNFNFCNSNIYIYIYVFYRNDQNLDLILAIIVFLSIILIAWFGIKEDTTIKQIGTDLLYCSILQGPAIGLETICLLNVVQYSKHPLLVLFTILLNLLFIILFDCLIQHVNFQNIRISKFRFFIMYCASSKNEE